MGHDREARIGPATTVHRIRPLSGAAAANGARQYTEAERQRGVALAMQIGTKAAAAQLGTPQATVAAWLDKNRRDLIAARRAYQEAGGRLSDGDPPPDWLAVRRLEADNAGRDAVIVRQVTTHAAVTGNPHMVRAGAAYYTALVNQAQALSADGGVAALSAEAIEDSAKFIYSLGQRVMELPGVSPEVRRAMVDEVMEIIDELMHLGADSEG